MFPHVDSPAVLIKSLARVAPAAEGDADANGGAGADGAEPTAAAE